ncbi:hypothetical protein PHSY_000927 [Pseudozyma hubeiensis SY62]|uniref:Uncharacterized protein n=1 Tax=Pseudozyma hubeiensis (strain SY62) TaxID=1305764 RepID=R9NXT3_PSEHS|nr:hypothetical protein PHSY_000927 [Pseudozyma hubeiensis SY62]GAC93362.1 hypothetical protein PHSY_000927 [Pseudozyma hubeiensis SY62]
MSRLTVVKKEGRREGRSKEGRNEEELCSAALIVCCSLLPIVEPILQGLPAKIIRRSHLQIGRWSCENVKSGKEADRPGEADRRWCSTKLLGILILASFLCCCTKMRQLRLVPSNSAAEANSGTQAHFRAELYNGDPHRTETWNDVVHEMQKARLEVKQNRLGMQQRQPCRVRTCERKTRIVHGRAYSTGRGR